MFAFACRSTSATDQVLFACHAMQMLYTCEAHVCQSHQFHMSKWVHPGFRCIWYIYIYVYFGIFIDFSKSIKN